MRLFIALGFLSLTFVCVFVTPAMADGPLEWKGAGSGDWNGKRTHLDEDIGLTFLWLQTRQSHATRSDERSTSRTPEK